MKISGYRDFSLTDGEGTRLVIFMSGCIHDCKGCHNKDFQDYNHGEDYTIEEVITYIKSRIKWIDGITLSGGDPLFQLNDTRKLLEAIQEDEDLRALNIWLYTGYKFEDIPDYVKTKVNVIVDGPYESDRPRAKWRGSDNQKVYKKVRRGSKHFYEAYEPTNERIN